MDARPSPEQRELQESADRLAAKLGPASVGELDDADRRSRLEAALAQAGWRDLRTGTMTHAIASGVEAAIVMRALGRRVCDTPYLAPVLALDLLRRAGYEHEHEHEGSACTIVMDASLSNLAGTGGAHLDHAGLAVDTAGAATGLVLITGAEDGSARLGEVALGPAATGVDLTRPVTGVPAGSAVIPVDGTSPLSADALTAWTALAVTLTAADLVGVMEGTLGLATEYAKQRRQYGAPIGSYQAIQHVLAEAATLIEGATSAMIHAAWAVDALDPGDARAAAAVAKAYAARAARTVCETSIQVHGGIGNTWECMAHVYLRRTLLATELFGTDGSQLALLAHRRWGAGHGLS